jgi:hypothetical protein
MHKRPERVEAAESICGNFPDMDPMLYSETAAPAGIPYR